MNDFDKSMYDRLRASKSEAARVVLDLHKGGRKMPDAIADAVESLPWAETTQLRRWTDNWQAWIEWERFNKSGWWVRATSRIVLIAVPESKQKELARTLNERIRASYATRNEMLTLIDDGLIPSEEIAAAAGDVGEVEPPYVVDAPPARWPYVVPRLRYDVKRQK